MESTSAISAASLPRWPAGQIGNPGHLDPYNGHQPTADPQQLSPF